MTESSLPILPVAPQVMPPNLSPEETIGDGNVVRAVAEHGLHVTGLSALVGVPARPGRAKTLETQRRLLLAVACLFWFLDGDRLLLVVLCRDLFLPV